MRLVFRLRIPPCGAVGVILVICGHNTADQLVAHHIIGSELLEVNPGDVAQDLAHDAQARDHTAWQVHLRNIASDHHLGTKTKAGEEHLHLRRGGVLRLI